MTPMEFNITEYSKAFTSKIEHCENKNVLFIGLDDIDVISEIINQKYKNCNIYIVDNKETCDCISLLDLKANIYVLNSYNEENNYIKEVFGPLNFYDDILISVWKNGASIATSALKLLKENGTCICSMLMSNYKKNELYRHVDTFELANPKLFKDAEIQKNLAIATLNAKKVDKYEMYDLYISSYDRRYILFYEWNISNSKSFTWKNASYTPAKKFDLDKDFIDITRCYSSGHGRTPGFGKKGFGYKFNMLRNTDWSSADIGVLHFESKQAKDNYCKYAYNWSTQVGDCLCSKVMAGLHLDHATGTCLPSIPQIDWEHISDKYPDYEKDPDYYVLKEMGLKWDDKKEKIIKE